MKAILTFILITLFCVSIQAQTTCKPYVPAKVGAKWEMSDYNKKEKLTGRTAYEVLDIQHVGNTSEFKIKITMFDKKDKEVYSSDYVAKCTNGVFQVDMSSLLKGDQLNSVSNTEFTVNASELVIPTFSEPAGTILEGGTVTIAPDDPALSMLKVKVEISDRKIEGYESKTSPAGTFDTMVLTQKIKTKIIVNLNTTSKEWHAEGVGLVRSEVYNKRGKLIGYSELSKLEM